MWREGKKGSYVDCWLSQRDGLFKRGDYRLKLRIIVSKYNEILKRVDVPAVCSCPFLYSLLLDQHTS